MELYKREFGDSFSLGFSQEQFPWLKDKSWHNDVCPSFIINTTTGYLILWVDFAHESHRELDQERYIVITATNVGTEEYPEIHNTEDDTIVFSTEYKDEIMNYLSLLSASIFTSD
jgi:hypothetical protein